MHASGMTERHGAAAAILRLLDEVEALLKEPGAAMELARRGINTSIALVASQGLAAYLDGNTRRAMDDLETAVDEIRARLERR
jgi:hypothetical protein